MSNKKEIATKLYKRVRREQLEKMKEKMPSDVQGVEFKQNGITYVAFIRRLAPAECDRLQTIPEWYDWGGISETQHLKMDGTWRPSSIAGRSFPTSDVLSECGPSLMVWLAVTSC